MVKQSMPASRPNRYAIYTIEDDGHLTAIPWNTGFDTRERAQRAIDKFRADPDCMPLTIVSYEA